MLTLNSGATPMAAGKLPESNADDVAKRLVTNAIDLDGEGLVRLLGLLLGQAEELRAIHRRASTLDAQVSSDPLVDAASVRGAFQEALYEPVCIEWLLSRVLKELAGHLEFRVYQRQQQFRPLARITYTEAGQVENYRLQPSDNH